MLTACPECELPVSDKAYACPRCGYPLKKDTPPRSRQSTKRKRLPNGFGQISKINNKNLRKPYRAMVTVGKDPNGKPISKILKPEGYFATYNDAYAALVEYNRNPYDLEDDITVKEIYEKWSEEYFKESSRAYIRTVESAWAYCSSVYTMRVKDLKPRHIKGCMDNGYRIETVGKNKGQKVYPSSGTKSRMKSLFNLMLDYALEHELVTINYARTFDVSNDIVTDIAVAKRSHIPFTENEMNILWNNVNKVSFVDWILIQCYMGWRPQELATIKLSEVHLDKWYMQAGMKTNAGKQHIVPIHSKIQKFVQKNYDFALSIGSEYLLNDRGQTHAGSWKLTYDKYANRFTKAINQLHLNNAHRPHDPRVTFVTMGKKAEMDEYALKEMAGHSIQDITESVYTVRDLEWLRSDLEKIK